MLCCIRSALGSTVDSAPLSSFECECEYECDWSFVMTMTKTVPVPCYGHSLYYSNAIN